MRFNDILDDCSINEDVIDSDDKRYCTLLLSKKEYAMLRWALKTKDAIDDALEDELNILHGYNEKSTK